MYMRVGCDASKKIEWVLYSRAARTCFSSHSLGLSLTRFRSLFRADAFKKPAQAPTAQT